jgi:FAD/FMN-containing dehydrogenase
MATDADAPLDLLWKEYSLVFREFDDLTLARWMAQTLGQIEGKAWRLSHPLLGAYRLAAQTAHERQIWLMRLATPPAAYPESPCCRAPLLPLLTRDVREAGLICQHCSDTLVPFEEIPSALRGDLEAWAAQYTPVHAVAHWDDGQRKRAGDYDRAYENAAQEAEGLLARAGNELAPKLLEFYPAVIWEDQDECLEVMPEDVNLG